MDPNPTARDETSDRAQAIDLPDSMTRPCQQYFDDQTKLLGFVEFVSSLAYLLDGAAKEATQALYDTADSDEEREKYREELAEGGERTQRQLRKFRQLILQLVAARTADNFLLYVSDLLALVFKTRPETLRSNDQVRFDVVLQHDNMNDLVSTLAERKIQDLSYQGMRDVAAWVERRLGVTLFGEPAALKRAIAIVEVRNLIAHNRGIVNSQFLARVPDADTPRGEPLRFTIDGVLGDAKFLARAVFDLDERCSAKFGLPTTAREG